MMPATVILLRALVWRAYNCDDGVVQRQKKSPRRQRAPLGVPVTCHFGIQNCVGMPLKLTRSHGTGDPSPATTEQSPPI